MSKARRRQNCDNSNTASKPHDEVTREQIQAQPLVLDIASTPCVEVTHKSQVAQVISLRQPFQTYDEQFREKWRDWHRTFAAEIDAGDIDREFVIERIHRELIVPVEASLVDLVRDRLRDPNWSPAVHGWEPVAYLLIDDYAVHPLHIRALFLTDLVRLLRQAPQPKAKKLAYDEMEIVKALQKQGQPLHQEELLHAAKLPTDGTHKKVLAMMVERGDLDNCRARGGYSLPEWRQK